MPEFSRKKDIFTGMTIVIVFMLFVIASPVLLPMLSWVVSVFIQIFQFVLLCFIIFVFIVAVGTLYNRTTAGKMPGYYRLQVDEGQSVWNNILDFFIKLLSKGKTKPKAKEEPEVIYQGNDNSDETQG